MRKHEDRDAEGRLVAPPAVRIRIVRPRPLAAAEHPAAHDDRACAGDVRLDELRVGVLLPALQAVRLAPRLQPVDPLVQLLPALTERVLERRRRAGDVAVERNRDVAEARHAIPPGRGQPIDVAPGAELIAPCVYGAGRRAPPEAEPLVEAAGRVVLQHTEPDWDSARLGVPDHLLDERRPDTAPPRGRDEDDLVEPEVVRPVDHAEVADPLAALLDDPHGQLVELAIRLRAHRGVVPVGNERQEAVAPGLPEELAVRLGCRAQLHRERIARPATRARDHMRLPAYVGVGTFTNRYGCYQRGDR